MNTKLVLCAEGVVQDSQLNTASAFNIIEQITAAGLPFTIPKIAFLVLLKREPEEPEEFTSTVVITNNDVELVRHNVPTSFNGKLNNRITATVGGLAVAAVGALSFSLLDAAGNQLARWDIEVAAPPQA
jgi:hypothetical protein